MSCGALHSRKCVPALRCGRAILCMVFTSLRVQRLLAEDRNHVQGMAGVTDPSAIKKLCAEGRDAADFLMQNVVQAQLNDRGNYGRRLGAYHFNGSESVPAARDTRAVRELHAQVDCARLPLVVQP